MTEPNIRFATADDLRDVLDADYGTLDDDRANLAIDLAGASILSFTNRTKVGFDKVEGATFTIDGTGTDVLLLPVYPLLAVNTLTERLTSTELVDDVDFEWSEKGILSRLGGVRWSARARAYVADVDYNYEEIPTAVRKVAITLAIRLVQNPEGLATETSGGYAAGFGVDETRLPTVGAAEARDLAPFRIES